MTRVERRLRLRTIGAGASLLLTGFLPWFHKFSAWSSWLDLWGTHLPNWMVVVCGLAVAVLAFLELRDYANFSWKGYLSISVYGILHTVVFFIAAPDESPIQIGPPLALAALLVTAAAAVRMRPRAAKRGRRERTKKRGSGRRSGPSG